MSEGSGTLQECGRAGAQRGLANSELGLLQEQLYFTILFIKYGFFNSL